MKQSAIIFSFFLLAACQIKQRPEALLSTLPSFGMLLMDSTTLLKEEEIPMGKPIVLLYFRPDCPHCQKETQAFIDHSESLKHVQVYLLTNAPFEDIRTFYNHFQLANYKNFTVGKDYNHSFYNAFKPKVVPFLAVYDRNKKLVKIYGEEPDFNVILKSLPI